MVPLHTVQYQDGSGILRVSRPNLEVPFDGQSLSTPIRAGALGAGTQKSVRPHGKSAKGRKRKFVAAAQPRTQ